MLFGNIEIKGHKITELSDLNLPWLDFKHIHEKSLQKCAQIPQNGSKFVTYKLDIIIYSLYINYVNVLRNENNMNFVAILFRIC